MLVAGMGCDKQMVEVARQGGKVHGEETMASSAPFSADPWLWFGFGRTQALERIPAGLYRAIPRKYTREFSTGIGICWTQHGCAITPALDFRGCACRRLEQVDQVAFLSGLRELSVPQEGYSEGYRGKRQAVTCCAGARAHLSRLQEAGNPSLANFVRTRVPTRRRRPPQGSTPSPTAGGTRGSTATT
jgi:hypothetical protein